MKHNSINFAPDKFKAFLKELSNSMNIDVTNSFNVFSQNNPLFPKDINLKLKINNLYILIFEITFVSSLTFDNFTRVFLL